MNSLIIKTISAYIFSSLGIYRCHRYVVVIRVVRPSLSIVVIFNPSSSLTIFQNSSPQTLLDQLKPNFCIWATVISYSVFLWSYWCLLWIFSHGEALPDIYSLSILQHRYSEGIPIHWAVVDHGDIAFYSFTNFDIPVLLWYTCIQFVKPSYRLKY